MKVLLSLLALSLVTGCLVEKDAVFSVNGRVVNSNGHPSVLTADQSYQLCLDVNYQVFEDGTSLRAGHAVDCESIVTDQEGRYIVIKKLTLTANKGETIDIKNAQLYLRKPVSLSETNKEYYVTPANVRKVNITQKGGSAVADLTVF